MSADKLKKNQKGVIKKIIGENNLERQRLLHLGFVPGTNISCYQRVFGIYAFEVKGGHFAIRKESAKNIILK
jgi:Fe2+ transport system protein FeoA